MAQDRLDFGEKAGSLEQQIRQRIESLSYLPTTVAVAMKFVELGKNHEAEPADYARVISSDTSLSSKLLALANSSWFGVRNKVTRPNMAVNLLGLGTVRTLAISYCLTGLHNDLRLNSEESRMFWTASLCKAVAAKHYARHFDEKLAEEAFTAGLFEDFAIPVMFAVAREEFLPLLQDVQIDCAARLERERDLFHLDHAEIGRIVAQKLELPDVFVDAVAFHHNHGSLKEFVENTVIADAVYAASLFPHVLNAWNRADAQALRDFVAAHTLAKPLDVGEFLQSVQGEFNQLYGYFEAGKVPDLNLAELLEMATREAADNTTRLVGTMHELMRETASAGRELHEVLSQQSRLEEAAHRDALTGALNRQGFTSRFEKVIADAARYGTAFSIVYLDIDLFKKLNDTFGHNMGDLALKRLVGITEQTIRPTDFIGRLGGDEFVLVISDCAEADAVHMAQQIVSTAAAETIRGTGDSAPRMTISAGVLSLPPRMPPLSMDTLIAAADRLMYEAKRAGGNRLCRAQAGAPAASAAAA